MRTSTSTWAAQSDAELIRASSHCPAAFEALFERHAMVLQRWLVAQTGDAALANELVAETFACAWRGARRFRGDDECAGGAWLYAIARNLRRQHDRKGRVETAARQRLGISTLTSQDDGTEEIHDNIDAEKLGPAVREAFAELTLEQRRAIGYRVIDELSYDEVAARLNCATTTARTRVFRGLHALRTAIAKGAQP